MDNQNNDHKMMWAMMIFCALSLLFIFLGGSIVGGQSWVWIVILVIFVIGHFFLMNKFHKNKDHKTDTESH